MDLTEPDNTPAKAQLLVDKQQIIQTLQELIEQYPSNEIPFDVIERALSKFTGPRDLGRLKNNPAIDKLDKILAQHKIPPAL